MAIDLDQLIRDADPARHLMIPPPDADVARAALASRHLSRRPSLGSFGLLAAVAVTVAVIAVVVSLGRHGSPPADAGSALTPGALQAQATDPSTPGGWGMRSALTQGTQTCVQVGRLQSRQIGILGQDGSFGDDGRFHPLALQDRAGQECAPNDAHGHAFLNVFARQVPASAGTDSSREGCKIGPTPRGKPACPARDLRNLAYGLLGPDATSITYLTANGGQTTKPTTGPDGAYLIVLPATTQSCTIQSTGAQSCVGGPGILKSRSLQSGAITAVTYRDGNVCHLPTPNSSGVQAGSCAPHGYTAAVAPKFNPPHITAAEVKAPVSARAVPAKQYCYRNPGPGSVTIPCDHGVPRGYKQGQLGTTGHPPALLINISFTARLAATNKHSVYEWAYTAQSDGSNPRCPNGVGGSATTMTPIRAGQHVVLQSFQGACASRYTGLITYQPNGAPGRDTLSSPIRDGSTLVGRFSVTVR